MKQLFILTLLFISSISFSQEKPSCDQYSVFDFNSNPDLGIVIYTNDTETVWNALRLATYSQAQGDSVVIFLIGKGLDGYETKDTTYTITNLKDKFYNNGGYTIACGTCAKQRLTDEIEMCTIASIRDLYGIIKKSKKVISF